MRHLRWARKKNASVEQDIKRLICRWIELKGGYVRMYPAFRGTMDKKTGKYVTYKSQYMPAGVPDLLVCWPTWALLSGETTWRLVGVFYGIEVKRPAGSQLTMLGAKKQTAGVLSDDQKRELELIKRSGGCVLVAYSLDDVEAVLRPTKPPRVIAEMKEEGTT